ncbi:hypothetical protein G3580_12655 [Nitrogeniibacter mangrovi]|uniref:Uncharacterized protein n=1 Tax=Nitrogeniibacter mangrovi TaxID=2016596 RepID=A0A6C1B5T8_9RHOO|nr:hypothetical protein [Nitrogeniibacter mangrovi]QID18409.1 hypothetical protein G3580_12655 [Nitrogeniibacter mangrovi]
MITGDFSTLDGILLVVAVLIAALMLRPTVRDAPFWRATVTPLASIIGSGFLVVAPLLAHIAGARAFVAIVVIVLLSFWLGAAIRFNILHDGHHASDAPDRAVQALERVSDIALALAYVVSITFYIRLMCGFVLTGIHAYTPFNADVLATLILAFIGLYGLRRGLLGLERLEEYSVTIKLAIIASLLLGLMVHDVGHGYALGDLDTPDTGLWTTLRELAGMLLIVQGFETSKYLESTYPARLRARSMSLAQGLAGVIYLAFVALAMPLMGPYTRTTPDETAIIGLSGNITLVLPIMLVVAAAMSQFSAAIADTIGAGGVVEKETRKRVSARTGYPVIVALAIALIWTSHIFEVVTLASRAFALYYMLQAALAARIAAQRHSDGQRRWRVAAFAALAALMLLVVIFAKPVAA